jgi:hypothetical protein
VTPRPFDKAMVNRWWWWLLAFLLVATQHCLVIASSQHRSYLGSSLSFLFVLYSVAALDDILISIVFSPPEPITRSPAFVGRPAVPAHTNDICYDVIVKLVI